MQLRRFATQEKSEQMPMRDGSRRWITAWLACVPPMSAFDPVMHKLYIVAAGWNQHART